MTLMIHGHGSDTRTAVALSPYYKRSGASRIVAVNTVDSPWNWPCTHESVQFGREKSLICRDCDEYYYNLPMRLVDTLGWFLGNDQSDFICIAQHDTLFIKPDAPIQGKLLGHKAGTCEKRWNVRSDMFIHPPWTMDRCVAQMFYQCGFDMLDRGFHENGSDDVFIGLLCKECGVDLVKSNTFSRNGCDMHENINKARAAIASGVSSVHGVHEPDDIKYLVAAMPA